MNTQIQSTSPLVEYPQCITPSTLPANGPIQFLIIDQTNGPAEVVFNVFGRLFEFGVTLTVASTYEDVWDALHCYKFDLLAIGLEQPIVETLALVPNIRKDFPDLPIMGIARNLSPFHLTQYQQFGLDNVVEMPQRAGELKALLRALIQRYLME